MTISGTMIQATFKTLTNRKTDIQNKRMLSAMSTRKYEMTLRCGGGGE